MVLIFVNRQKLILLSFPKSKSKKTKGRLVNQ